MTITQCFQPPLYWQQFEDLTEGVFRVVYGDPKPTRFGRPGQAQNGVDVYGYQDGNGPLIAIQCKRMDELDENNLPRPGGAILKKHLREEIGKVSKFQHKPDLWILATTAKRDANIQRYAIDLSEMSRASGSFGIQVWFWDDFVTDLNRNHDLQRWYYDNVIQVQSESDQDKIILELLGMAFARPAFRMPLHYETPSHFMHAVADTQHALSTGELKDRETRRVISKTIGGRRAVACKTCSDLLGDSYDKLQQLREEFQDNLVNGVIQKVSGMLQIPATVQTRLGALRDGAVADVNAALRHTGLQPV